MKYSRRPGTALILTVVVVGLIMNLALGSAVVRFGQFNSANRSNYATIAKLAAEAGIRDIEANPTTKAKDIDSNADLTITDIASFKPNPRHSVYSIETSDSSLPRCLAVGVLSPWVFDGKYLFDNDTSTNPALIFHWANLINATKVTDIDTNIGNNGTGNTTISELSKMGTFYNPYAPAGTSQDSYKYWTINLGGPDDEFYQSALSNIDKISAYQNLDMLYIPYLPKWINDHVGTKSNKGYKTAEEVRQLFETFLTTNNFKVWVDSAVDTFGVDYERYGLGDLFKGTDNQIKWVQPKTATDLDEVAYTGPYTADNNTNTSWTDKGSSDIVTSLNIDTQYTPVLLKVVTAKSYYPTTTNPIVNSTTQYTLKVTDVAGLGLNSPVNLDYTFNGSSYIRLGANVTNINPSTSEIKVKANDAEFESKKASISTRDNLIAIRISQMTPASNIRPYTNTDIVMNWSSGNTFSVTNSYGCNAHYSCPSIGDIVQFRDKSGPATPVWGKIKSIASGVSINSIELDAIHASPPPLKEMASATVENDVYYYGGIIANDYDDGGNGEVSKDLWKFDGTNWTYITSIADGWAGSSLTSDGGNYLYIFGGYRYDYTSGTYFASSQENTLHSRLDKQLNNFTYKVDLTTKAASQLTSPASDQQAPLQDNVNLTVISTIDGRSGWDSAERSWKVLGEVGSATFNITDGTTTPIRLRNTPAGFAIGDTVDLSYKSGGVSYTDTGKIKSVVGGTNQLTIEALKTGDKNNIQVYTSSTESIQVRLAQHYPISNLQCNLQTFPSGTACISAQDIKGIATGDIVAGYKIDNDKSHEIGYGYVTSVSGKQIWFYSTNPSLLEAGTSESLLSYPAPRYNHGAAYNNNALYVWGGTSQYMRNTTDNYHPSGVWKLDTVTNIWSPVDVGLDEVGTVSSVRQVAPVASTKATLEMTRTSAECNSIAAIDDTPASYDCTFDLPSDRSQIRYGFARTTATVYYNNNGSQASVTGTYKSTTQATITLNLSSNGGNIPTGTASLVKLDSPGGTSIGSFSTKSYGDCDSGKCLALTPTDNKAISYVPGTTLAVQGDGGKVFYGTVSQREIDWNGDNITSVKLHFAAGRLTNTPHQDRTDSYTSIGNKLFEYASVTTAIEGGVKGDVWKMDDVTAIPAKWNIQPYSDETTITHSLQPKSRYYASLANDGANLYLVGGTAGQYPYVWKAPIAGGSWSILKTADTGIDISNGYSGNLNVANGKLIYRVGRLGYGDKDHLYEYYGANRFSGINNRGTGYDGVSGVEIAGSQQKLLTSIDGIAKLVHTAVSSPVYCKYAGQTDPSCDSFALLNLGMFGRFGLRDGSQTAPTGLSVSSYSSALIGLYNVGTEFKTLLQTPSIPSMNIGGRISDSEGYYPTTADHTRELHQAGYVTYGTGMLMVTASGVGSAMGRGTLPTAEKTRKYSYCGKHNNDSGKTCADKYAMTWLPDGEDVAFTLNATKFIANNSTFKITGYYGGVRKAYILVKKGATYVNFGETAP